MSVCPLGADFPSLALSITISRGDPQRCIPVTPVADQLFEGPEEFNLTLTNSTPSNFVELGPTITFSLTDADSK